jgi:hypothetical protein
MGSITLHHGRRYQALQAAIQQNLFTEADTLMLLDIDLVHTTIRHVQSEAGYPPATLHTFAVKANPVGKVLELFRDKGFGAEVRFLDCSSFHAALLQHKRAHRGPSSLSLRMLPRRQRL